MPVNRRNTLAILGLSSASAVGLEAIALERNSEKPSHLLGRLDRAKFVAALRAFADAVEAGELRAGKISVRGELSPYDAVRHVLEVEFFNIGTKADV